MNFIYPSGLPVALSLVGYNALLTSLFIVFKRRDKISAHYFLSSLFTFGWGVGLSFMLNNDLAPWSAQFWGRISQFSFFLMPVSWLHFILIYTHQFKENKGKVFLCYLTVILFLLFTPTSWFILKFREIVILNTYPVPGPAYKALTVTFFTILIYAFWEFYDSWRKDSSQLRKADYRFLFLTQLLGYGLCSLSLLPVYNWMVPQAQLLILPLWQFLLAYAMVRHNLLDYEEMAKAIHRDRLAVMATLTASMHHELRNPMTAIQTFAEYLPLRYDRPEFREKFKEIVPEEVRRINGILNQLLEFSKPQELELKNVDIVQVLKDILLFFNQQLQTSSIEVVTSFPENAGTYADSSQMKQVFLNLIINSMQAMPKGGILKIDVGETQDKNFLRISISDSGTGIKKENLKNIFEPFFTTKEKGTGLGLFIVHQIIEKHKGTIRVESVEGKGTAVHIWMKKAVL